MREIKFRGLNKNNEFVYGDLYSDIPNSTCYYKEYSQRISWFPESGGQANQPVKNGTVGEFTGLTDKNGVDIYEGDKLKCLDANGEYYFTEVYYNGGALTVDTNHRDYDYIAIGWAFNQGDIEEAEVIGNVHQNSELLTEEE